MRFTIFTQRGAVNTGALYIMAIMFILIAFAFMASGPTPSRNIVPNGIEVVAGNPVQEPAKDRLQLYSFGGATITPPAGSLCQPGGVNSNPGIIIGYSPMHGKGVSTKGQIKLWINDSAPIKIASDEAVTRSNGVITKPGDRTLLAPDGYIYEPALYIFPNTIDAGGTPYFPEIIRGSYNNGNGNRISYGGEPPPAYVVVDDRGHSAQIIWSVAGLGLGPGSYELQFVVHDGAEGRAVGCVSIRVYEEGDTRNILPL